MKILENLLDYDLFERLRYNDLPSVRISLPILSAANEYSNPTFERRRYALSAAAFVLLAMVFLGWLE